MMNKFLVLFIAILVSLSAHAQSIVGENFYTSGKINVVIGVIAIIFIGIVFYLVRLDRKISKLEEKED